jgi:hypothetical protein
MAGAKTLLGTGHGDVYRRRFLVWGVVVAFTMSSLSSVAGENPRSGPLDQAATAPWCRYLLEDVISTI